MKRAIYGGTFDPPHIGHKKVIEAILKNTDIDQIDVIPTYTPPHKSIGKDTPTAEMRLEMTRLTFKSMSKVTVSDIEILNKGISYTYLTIKQYLKMYPEDELFLIIGSDMLLTFTEWNEYKYILEKCRFIVLSRTGEDYKELKEALFDGSILIYSEPVVISSSQIRENIEENKDYLEKDVYNYIKENNLYGS